MNQQWNLKDTFLLSPDGFWQFYTYEVIFNFKSQKNSFYSKISQATIMKRVNTKKHQCVEDNSFKLAKCYDDFYMKKISCSFPWLKSYSGPLRKCGSDDKIKDLVELVNQVNLREPNIIKEIKDFGCSTSNCEEVKWSISSWQRAEVNVPNMTYLELNFPSSSKVLKITIATFMIIFFNCL